MSLVQWRCRLELVQHHSLIRFGRETNNNFSVIKLQENVFLHWCQQQSFIAVDQLGVKLWLHQRQLRKAAVGRSNGTRRVSGQWRQTNLTVGGHPSGAKRRKNFFVMVSTVWPVCCLQFTVPPPVPYGVGATVYGYALGGSDNSLTLEALTRLFFASTPTSDIVVSITKTNTESKCNSITKTNTKTKTKKQY